jgi:membrane protease YdiL (CAAX protease family)
VNAWAQGENEPMEQAEGSPAREETPAPAGIVADQDLGRQTPPLSAFNKLFLGPNGLRAGWSIAFATSLFYALRFVVGTVFATLNLIDDNSVLTASSAIVQELIPFIAMFGAVAAIARIEGRSMFSYNLTGPRRFRYFLLGAVSGFAVLSALIAVLGAGGWMRFGPSAQPGFTAIRFALLWGCAFLLVGCVEEGTFRCYILSTLTRGLNFWWALAAVAGLCVWPTIDRSASQSTWGVYVIALLGLFPCLYLYKRVEARSAFWQAALVTSTAFGLIHTYNHGENAIGIFAAAAIGFTWCASIRVTGSAFWAIGCHAAWDWGETFFYGAADSGLPSNGHLFTAVPAGNPLLSGGVDGPEGSLLIIGAILFLLGLIYAAPWMLRAGKPTAVVLTP